MIKTFNHIKDFFFTPLTILNVARITTVTGMLGILYGGISYRLKFGGDVFNNTAGWGTYGDYLGGFGGSIIALMAMFWLITSVDIQRRELGALRDQIKTDRIIEDCRSFLSSNLTDIQNVGNRSIHPQIEGFYTKVSFRGEAPTNIIQLLEAFIYDSDRNLMSPEIEEGLKHEIRRKHELDFSRLLLLLDKQIRAIKTWNANYQGPDTIQKMPYGAHYQIQNIKSYLAGLDRLDALDDERIQKFYDAANDEEEALGFRV